MFLARVTGSVVATQKAQSMTGHKLLVVEPLRVDPQDRTKLTGTGRSFVAVDALGAGINQMVLIVQGSTARFGLRKAARAKAGPPVTQISFTSR